MEAAIITIDSHYSKKVLEQPDKRSYKMVNLAWKWVKPESKLSKIYII